MYCRLVILRWLLSCVIANSLLSSAVNLPSTGELLLRVYDRRCASVADTINGKALLAQAIQSIIWTPLYQTGTCEMAACFYDTITSLVDYHLPLRNVKRHSTDKLWITDQLRRLIRCRQNALKNGQTDRYKM